METIYLVGSKPSILYSDGHIYSDLASAMRARDSHNQIDWFGPSYKVYRVAVDIDPNPVTDDDTTN